MMRTRPSVLFILAALAAAGCGYRTYLAPTPTHVHQGEPLPLHAALAVTDASAGKDASRSLLGYDGATVRSFLADYLQKTNLFAQTDANLPGDVEIFTTIIAMQTTAEETPLLSRENKVECMVRLQYRTFCRFKPDLVVAGESSGFGRADSPTPLTVGHYQQAMSQALDRAASKIFADLSAALVPRSAEIRAWAAADKANAASHAPTEEKKQEEWEEIKPAPKE